MSKYKKPLCYILKRVIIHNKEQYFEPNRIICWDCIQITDREDYSASPRYTMKELANNSSCEWCKKEIKEMINNDLKLL
tara:strand:+ start:214 stop:450 length:237 start_codon:yes stop_codon:yes gene_type:complete